MLLFKKLLIRVQKVFIAYQYRNVINCYKFSEVITVDSDSEEDVVIVLNADNKTNKKKKILK